MELRLGIEPGQLEPGEQVKSSNARARKWTVVIVTALLAATACTRGAKTSSKPPSTAGAAVTTSAAIESGATAPSSPSAATSTTTPPTATTTLTTRSTAPSATKNSSAAARTASGSGTVTLAGVTAELSNKQAPVSATAIGVPDDAMAALVVNQKRLGIGHGAVVQLSASSTDVAGGVRISVALPTAAAVNQSVTLAYWDTAALAWRPVTSALSPDRRTVSATVTHFSWWTALISNVDNFAGSLLDTRVDAPTCSSPVPSWVQKDGVVFLDDQNAPLRWCAGHDPANAALLVVKVRINRGYGMTVRNTATPAWSWNSFVNQDALEITKSIFHDVDDTVQRELEAIVGLGGGGGQIVPGGDEADFGFTETAVRNSDRGGEGLLTVDQPDPAQIAMSMFSEAISDSVSDTPIGYATTVLGISHCLTSFSKDLSKLSSTLYDCANTLKEQIEQEMDSTLAKSGAKWLAKMSPKEIATLAHKAVGKFFAYGLLAQTFFQAATAATDTKLISAARQISVFPTIQAPPPSVAINVTPFFADGRVRYPLGSPYDGDIGACSGSPAAKVPNVYTCGSTAADLPACWPDPAGSLSMYCMRAATDTKIIKVTKPEPADFYPADGGEAQPWTIVLDDGTTCGIRLGGAWPMPPEGYVYSDECDGSVDALVRPNNGSVVNTAKAHWTVQAAKNAVDNPPLTTLGVKRVYYAGPAPTLTPVQTGDACPSASELQAALRPGYKIEHNNPGDLTCLNGWARASYDNGEDAAVGAFKQINGQWTQQSLDTLCTPPSPLPAAMYPSVCMVN